MPLGRATRRRRRRDPRAEEGPTLRTWQSDSRTSLGLRQSYGLFQQSPRQQSGGLGRPQIVYPRARPRANAIELPVNALEGLFEKCPILLGYRNQLAHGLGLLSERPGEAHSVVENLVDSTTAHEEILTPRSRTWGLFDEQDRASAPLSHRPQRLASTFAFTTSSRAGRVTEVMETAHLLIEPTVALRVTAITNRSALDLPGATLGSL